MYVGFIVRLQPPLRLPVYKPDVICSREKGKVINHDLRQPNEDFGQKLVDIHDTDARCSLKKQAVYWDCIIITINEQHSPFTDNRHLIYSSYLGCTVECRVIIRRLPSNN